MMTIQVHQHVNRPASAKSAHCSHVDANYGGFGGNFRASSGIFCGIDTEESEEEFISFLEGFEREIVELTKRNLGRGA
jgi:hypothetical protein